MSIEGACGVCGQPGHRYGTTDPEHKFDAVACVNGLLPRLAELQAERPTPNLNTEEAAAMDSINAAYHQIGAWGLRCNRGELTAAVHVVQGFIVQHMLQRADPDAWGAWFETDPGEDAPEDPRDWREVAKDLAGRHPG